MYRIRIFFENRIILAPSLGKAYDENLQITITMYSESVKIIEDKFARKRLRFCFLLR